MTVTHPEVKRYFMTIPEACQLILEAGAIGNGGEVFVLDMGEPIRISYLAEQMVRLAGKVPGSDIEIVYTGLRPGEKLFEELFATGEQLSGTGHEKLLLARFREIDWQHFDESLAELERACREDDENGVRRQFASLVPEYRGGDAAEANVVVLGSLNR